MFYRNVVPLVSFIITEVATVCLFISVIYNTLIKLMPPKAVLLY